MAGLTLRIEWNASSSAPKDASATQATPAASAASVTEQPFIRPSARELTIYGCLVLAATLAVTLLVVKNLSGTLLGSSDESLFSYQSYYFGQNLRLFPYPKLNLNSNQTFYPYGADHVFQPWGFEREYLGASCRALFGPGPWMQTYFLFSLVVTAVGAYALLRRDYPAWRAMAIGLAVSFANYYAIGKYPGHLNIACPHWVVLSVIADFLIFKRLISGQAISTRRFMGRGALLMLSFGLDLGYICGIGLTSALLTATVGGLVLVCRAGGSLAVLGNQLLALRASLLSSYRQHRVQVGLLATLGLTLALLYFPLIIQISRHVKGIGSLGDQGCAYANPLRLTLLCCSANLDKIGDCPRFFDKPEAFFASTPGLAFVIPGILGLILARRRAAWFAPLLVLMALIMVYHPHYFPVLRALPWFAFARVQGRFTIIYPTLFALFSLGIPAGFFRHRAGQLLTCCTLGLLLSEVSFAYQSPMIRNKECPLATDGSFDPFMQTVRATAGEAVMEWPFCVAAGNGGCAKLNSFYDRLYATFVLRQFHEKKTVGQFFSRLHPNQSQVFLDRGWERFYAPDSANIFQARRQTRDVTPQEWQMLEDFFVLNDFCGIILYTDILPPETVARFHERFGQPVAVTSYSSAGRMEFIPKPAELRSKVNLELGRQVALAPAELQPGQRIDMTSQTADAYLGNGWSMRPQAGTARSIAGREAELEFAHQTAGPVVLRCEVTTLCAQRLRLELNGQLLGEASIAAGWPQTIEVPLSAGMLAPLNRLKLVLPSQVPLEPGLGSLSVLSLNVAVPSAEETAPAPVPSDASASAELSVRPSVAPVDLADSTRPQFVQEANHTSPQPR